ncbi:hypothetical protein CR513_33058, partial [Mucuna pruriens]
MDAEIQDIQRNDTWELIDPPPNCKIVSVKWIFKTKLKETEEIDKFKARLVAKGYTQEEGINYKEIFSPVARLETIRTIVTLTTTKRWSIYQLDIKSAFLHGKINEDVYLEQPLGSLMYLTTTRPNIAHSVSLINRFMDHPKDKHFLVAKRILRYLQGTQNLRIFYKAGGNEELLAYTDSDYTGDLDDRKSTSSYAFLLGGGVISWAPGHQINREQLADIISKPLKVKSFQRLRSALGMLEEPKINCCKEHTI